MSYFEPESLASPVRPGDLVQGDMVGNWRVEQELGRGGMGTVYAVLHSEIGKRAALKVIHQHALTDEYNAERFLIEARAVNTVTHPNIVDIFESGTLPDGRPFLVMERLDGKTLGDRQDEGRLPAIEVIDYLVPLCDALAAAHAVGVVHRDIKLDNVFLVDATATQLSLGGGPSVKLLDWGIASMVNRDGERSYGNLMVGTPRYVAPEQARGERVTTASDVYSLGVVAYELFLEEAPFNAPSAAELLVMHLTEAPPMPHEVWPLIPPALEELLLAMLAKTPSLRPSITQVAETLMDLRAELRRCTSSPMIAVTEPRATPRAFPRAATPDFGRDPTQLNTSPAEPALVANRWQKSWRWVAAAAIVMSILGLRMFVKGGGPAPVAAATTDAPIAGTVTPSAEIAPEPEPIVGPAPSIGVPVVTSPSKAVHRAVRNLATGAPVVTVPAADVPAAGAPVATKPAAAAPVATKPTPKPTRKGLHPDAVIDPY